MSISAPNPDAIQAKPPRRFLRLCRRSTRCAPLLLALTTAALPAAAEGDLETRLRRHFELGDKAFRESRLDDAVAQFREVTKLSPSLAEAHAKLGVIFYSQRRYPEAAAAFEQAVRHKPSLKRAEAMLGISMVRAGDLRGAIPHLGKAFKDPPDAALGEQCGLVLLEAHHKLGELDEALGVARKLMDESPSNTEALYSAYRLYSDLGSRTVARLVREGRDSARLHQVTAELLEAQGDYPQAVEQYRRAIEKDPQLPGIHRALGVALLNASPDAAARLGAQQEFQLELAANPADYHSEYQLGEIHWAVEEREEALRRYRRAVELNGNFVDALIALGKVHTVRGEADKALTYLEKAARLDPENEVVHYRLSQAYRKLGRLDDAKREAKQFEELREAAASIGRIYEQVQRKPVIEQSVEQGVVGGP